MRSAPQEMFRVRWKSSTLRRVEALPEATRRLILLAAADPLGDATLLWRAAERLSIEASAAAPAADAGLLEIDDRVRFRHPLVRSAVYRAASLGDRQRVHEALAEVSDPEFDADRRAWHRALAAAGPDEAVAAELEDSAERARTRGGLAAAAAFLERATALTAHPRGPGGARAGNRASEPPDRRVRHSTGARGDGGGRRARRAPERAGGSAARPRRPRVGRCQPGCSVAAEGSGPARAVGPGARARDLSGRVGGGDRGVPARHPRGNLPSGAGPSTPPWASAAPRPAARGPRHAELRRTRPCDSDAPASRKSAPRHPRWRTSCAGAGWPRRRATPSGTTTARSRSQRARSGSCAMPAHSLRCRSTSPRSAWRARGSATSRVPPPTSPRPTASRRQPGAARIRPRC